MLLVSRRFIHITLYDFRNHRHFQRLFLLLLLLNYDFFFYPNKRTTFSPSGRIGPSLLRYAKGEVSVTTLTTYTTLRTSTRVRHHSNEDNLVFGSSIRTLTSFYHRILPSQQVVRHIINYFHLRHNVVQSKSKRLRSHRDGIAVRNRQNNRNRAYANGTLNRHYIRTNTLLTVIHNSLGNVKTVRSTLRVFNNAALPGNRNHTTNGTNTNINNLAIRLFNSDRHITINVNGNVNRIRKYILLSRVHKTNISNQNRVMSSHTCDKHNMTELRTLNIMYLSPVRRNMPTINSNINMNRHITLMRLRMNRTAVNTTLRGMTTRITITITYHDPQSRRHTTTLSVLQRHSKQQYEQNIIISRHCLQANTPTELRALNIMYLSTMRRKHNTRNSIIHNTNNHALVGPAPQPTTINQALCLMTNRVTLDVVTFFPQS